VDFSESTRLHTPTPRRARKRVRGRRLFGTASFFSSAAARTTKPSRTMVPVKKHERSVMESSYEGKLCLVFCSLEIIFAHCIGCEQIGRRQSTNPTASFEDLDSIYVVSCSNDSSNGLSEDVS
jgi:hypothetical protein